MLQKHSNTVKQKRKNWQHDFCVFQEPAQWKHLRHRTAPCPSTSSHKDDLCNSVHQTKFAFLNQIWVLLLLVFCSTWCDMCFTCINIYALLHENSFIYLLSISWKTRQFIYCSINNENVFQHWERTKLTLHWHLKHFKRFLKFVLWTNLPLSYLVLSYLFLIYSRPDGSYPAIFMTRKQFLNGIFLRINKILPASSFPVKDIAYQELHC